MAIAAVIAALVCAAQLPAEQARVPDPQASDAGKEPRPLSREDEELLKDLAVLERLELLKNLELFEDRDEPDAGLQRPQ
jgi:hypothetical protein